MKKSNDQKAPAQTAARADGESWEALYANIRRLAVRKSAAMAEAGGGEDADGFNADARTLRLLMSAADIAQRMRRYELEEKDDNDETADQEPFNDRAERALESVKHAIERAEAEDPDGLHALADAVARADAPGPARRVSGSGRSAVGGERA